MRPGYGFEDDSPVVDVAIICDGKHEQLNGAGLLHVESEITSKVWYGREDSPGWPLVHFLPESSLGRRDPATVRGDGGGSRAGRRGFPLSRE